MVEHLLAKEGVAGSSPVSRSFFIMKFKTEKIKDKAQSYIEISFDSSDLNEAFEQAYLLKQKTFAIPGFRKGKVPLKTVKKNFSNESIQDLVFNRLADSTVRSIVENLEPKMYRQPSLSVKTYKENESLILEGYYDTEPLIEISEYKNIEVDVEDVYLEDLDIESEIKGIQYRCANKELKEEDGIIEQNDSVVFEWAETEIENKFPKKQRRSHDFNQNEELLELEKNLLGLEKGDSKKFSYTYSENCTYEALRGKTYFFDITVVEIYKVRLPEIDDELARQYDEEMNSLEDLKNYIRETINIQIEADIKTQTANKILKLIVEKSNYELPKSLVDDEANSIFKKVLERNNLTSKLSLNNLPKENPEVIKLSEQCRESAEYNLKVYYTRDKICSKENLRASEEEVVSLVKNICLNDEKKINESLKNKNLITQVKITVEMQKFNDFLYESAKKNLKEKISYSDFIKKEKGANL